MTAPKTMTGRLYGGGAPLDVAAALLRHARRRVAADDQRGLAGRGVRPQLRHGSEGGRRSAPCSSTHGGSAGSTARSCYANRRDRGPPRGGARRPSGAFAGRRGADVRRAARALGASRGADRSRRRPPRASAWRSSRRTLRSSSPPSSRPGGWAASRCRSARASGSASSSSCSPTPSPWSWSPSPRTAATRSPMSSAAPPAVRPTPCFVRNKCLARAWHLGVCSDPLDGGGDRGRSSTRRGRRGSPRRPGEARSRGRGLPVPRRDARPRRRRSLWIDRPDFACVRAHLHACLDRRRRGGRPRRVELLPGAASARARGARGNGAARLADALPHAPEGAARRHRRRPHRPRRRRPCPPDLLEALDERGNASSTATASRRPARSPACAQTTRRTRATRRSAASLPRTRRG